LSWLLGFVAIVIVVAVFAAVISRSTDTGSKAGFPYVRAKTLFSPAERSFLGVLDRVVGSEHRVFGKVRVADLALVKTGLVAAARQAALNRVAAKHFDFVVCRSSDLAVVCAVELNDSSHSSKRAQARDELLAKVCEVIGLPLVQLQAKRAYSVQELQVRFASVIGSAPVVETVAT
jgi:hypothetical protein